MKTIINFLIFTVILVGNQYAKAEEFYHNHYGSGYGSGYSHGYSNGYSHGSSWGYRPYYGYHYARPWYHDHVIYRERPYVVVEEPEPITSLFSVVIDAH